MRHRQSRVGTGLRAAAWLLAASVLGAALASGDVAAQTAPPAPAQAAPVPPAAAEAAGTPAIVVDGRQIESVLGKPVRSPTGDDMGRIVDVLIDHTGAVRAAVIDFGGFFGVGSRKIAVDWHVLHFSAEGKSDTIEANLPQDRLRVAPVYKEGDPVVILGSGPAPVKAPAAATTPQASATTPATVSTTPPAAAPGPASK